jgi:cyanophycinase
VGGAADSVLSDFVRLAGGEKANIAIITHASEDPASAGDELQNALTALNVKNTTVILPGNTTGLPSGTNAVFICGGDQNRLKRLLTDPLLKQLSHFDGLIGGSSAGAMIAAPRMIAGGMDENTVRAQRLKVVDGLVFLPKVVVDTHVGQRSRDTRCAAALALIPEVKLAIGLDEDTAVHVDKTGKCTVYGAGHARLFTRGPKFSSTISKVLKGEIANVRDLRLSLLCSGDEFDLVDFTN